MIFEEYCSYILSRERYLSDFTIPGSNIRIEKNELLTSMREVLRDDGDKDYDKLLVNTLLCYVSKDHLGKNHKFDENMDVIIGNIRKRVELINTLQKDGERALPFSYERVFEILVYYLRLVTNILNSEKGQKVRYVTADIAPEAILYVLNRKLTTDNLDAAWETYRWKAFFKDAKPLSAGLIDNYLKIVLLATYIRYREIKDK